MTALVPIGRKLAPLVRLLGSPVDGEVVGAARAIGRMLNTAGCDFTTWPTWSSAPPCRWLFVATADISLTRAANGAILARRCLGHFGNLRPIERRFLKDIINWRGTPTHKQLMWLQAIADALGVDRRAA